MVDGATNYPPPGAPPPSEPAGGPPPGAVPPAPPAPYAPYLRYAPYAPRGPRPAPGPFLGAAHKPGAFALRPLRLGDIYDGAFRIIRFNPRATVGAAVLVTTAAMLVPVVITAVLTFTIGLALDSSGEVGSEASLGELIGLLAAYGSLLVAIVLAQVGTILVTGMIAHVTRAAAVGRRLDLRQAWDLTHGKRWRLLGLTLLINLAYVALLLVYVLMWVGVVLAAGDAWGVIVAWGLVTVPAFFALCAWLWVRCYYLPVPALMLEPVGVFGAIARGWRLTAGNFWRTFGIGLLTVVISSMAGGLLSTPVTVVGEVGAVLAVEYAALILVLTQAVALILQNALVAPMVATVTSIQYVDLRIRKEALDVELLREAGVIPS